MASPSLHSGPPELGEGANNCIISFVEILQLSTAPHQ